MSTRAEEYVAARMAVMAAPARPVDPARLAAILGCEMGSLPIDMLVFQSRECGDDAMLIEQAAMRLAAVAEPSFWIGHMLAVGQVTRAVVEIAAQALSFVDPIHPLARWRGASIEAAASIFDAAISGDVINFALPSGRVAPSVDTLMLLDLQNPLESWIVGSRIVTAITDAGSDGMNLRPAADGATIQAAGRLANIVDAARDSQDVQWIGGVIAIFINRGADLRPSVTGA